MPGRIACAKTCLASHERRETLHFDEPGVPCEASLLRPDGSRRGPPRWSSWPTVSRPKRASGCSVCRTVRRPGNGSDDVRLSPFRRQRGPAAPIWSAIAASGRIGKRLSILPAACRVSTRRRIALWGTSFSGGHVIDCASRNPNVAAVVAQVPMLDVPRSLRGYPLRYFGQGVWHGMRDMLRAATLRAPHRDSRDRAARPFAAMNKRGCESGYRPADRRRFGLGEFDPGAGAAHFALRSADQAGLARGLPRAAGIGRAGSAHARARGAEGCCGDTRRDDRVARGRPFCSVLRRGIRRGGSARG